MHMWKFCIFSFFLIYSICLLPSCKKDDEPNNKNLSVIMVGVWNQDGDDDILVINSNGTGSSYDDLEDYRHNIIDTDVVWELNNDFIYLSFVYENGESQDEKLKAISVTNDKIIWYRYEEFKGEFSDTEYELWTWIRFQ